MQDWQPSSIPEIRCRPKTGKTLLSNIKPCNPKANSPAITFNSPAITFEEIQVQLAADAEHNRRIDERVNVQQ